MEVDSEKIVFCSISGCSDGWPDSWWLRQASPNNTDNADNANPHTTASTTEGVEDGR
jgi:hypothetical protein